jgi:hypothetical protein
MEVAMTLRRITFTLAFLMGMTIVPVIAQVPQQEKIHFDASTPFELKGTNVVLPSGHYILFQIKPNDRSEFALYQGDMTHSPVAIIRAVRIYYSLGRLPGKTKMLMDINEASPQSYPMLEGWNVPGDYGWRVIGVTPRTGALVTRVK